LCKVIFAILYFDLNVILLLIISPSFNLCPQDLALYGGTPLLSFVGVGGEKAFALGKGCVAESRGKVKGVEARGGW